MKPSKTYQKSQVLQKSESQILIYKAVGKTPLQAIKELGITEKVGYAGRLDPMAEGIVLLLVGDENKKKHAYEQMPKTYEFECLFGVETDSLDVLGLVSHVHSDNQNPILVDTVKRTLSTFKGNRALPYPIYSSKRVNSKPLFYWARNHQLDRIHIPTKHVEIEKIDLMNFRTMLGQEIAHAAIEKVSLVTGDFRQQKIILKWREFEKEYGTEEFCVAHITASVSSGTYIRSLCREIGRSLGTTAMALSIKRTRVGMFHL